MTPQQLLKQMPFWPSEILLIRRPQKTIASYNKLKIIPISSFQVVPWKMQECVARSMHYNAPEGWRSALDIARARSGMNL